MAFAETNQEDMGYGRKPVIDVVLPDKVPNYPVETIEIYKKINNEKDDYLGDVNVFDKFVEKEINTNFPISSDRKIANKKYYKQQEKYLLEIAEGKHPPLTIQNPGPEYRVEISHDIYKTNLIHVAYFDKTIKKARYLGYMVPKWKKGTSPIPEYFELYFLHQEDSIRYSSLVKKNNRHTQEEQYVYLERDFGDELYNKKQEDITLEELNKNNLDNVTLARFFNGFARCGSKWPPDKHFRHFE